MGTYLDSGLYVPDIGESEAIWPPIVNENFRILDERFQQISVLAGEDMQAAVDELPPVTYSGEHPSGGGTVVLGPGDHTISDLDVYDLTRLVGSGISATRLLITGGGITPVKASGQNFVRSFSIENMRVEASGTPTYGLNLKDVVYYTLANLDVNGTFSGASIWLNGGFGAAWNRVYVNRNVGGIGLLADPTGSAGLTINTHVFNACHFRTCATGIKGMAPASPSVPNGGENVLNACIIESNTDVGLDLYAVGPWLYNGVHFENNTNWELRTNLLNTHYCVNQRFRNCSFGSWRIKLDGDKETEFDGVHPAYSTPAVLGRITATANSVAPRFKGVARYGQAQFGTNGAVNFASGGTWPVIDQPHAIYVLTDSATVTPDVREGDYFTLLAGGSRTIASPFKPAYFEDDVQAVPRGWKITFDVLNNTAGAITPVFNAIYKQPANPTIAAAKRQTATFVFDGTNWIIQGGWSGDI